MTRTSDVFISLDQRLKISHEAGADLFISLHADSLADAGFQQSIRGATVYTLSERASDEQARLMAEKENASDLAAGLTVDRGRGRRPGQEHPDRPHEARDRQLLGGFLQRAGAEAETHRQRSRATRSARRRSRC